MNLILLHPEDFHHPDRVLLKDHRAEHTRRVLRAHNADRVRVGLVNGLSGTGVICSDRGDSFELEVVLNQPPPPALPITLLLALPRPKMLKRILQAVSSLGVKNIFLINSYRVDKSFWGSPLLQTHNLEAQLHLGLEQARDTIMPKVNLRPRFKPFVEDELPQVVEGTCAYVAHPGGEQQCPAGGQQPITLAVGPEGGFIPYEIDQLTACGFVPITLGPRVLRVETAVPVLLARLSTTA